MEDDNDFNPSNHHHRQEETDLVDEIVGVIESIAQFGDYRRTQRKECDGLVRRMKLLLPVLEEIPRLDRPFPEEATACLVNLKKTLLMAKKLLKTCHEGSKIYLALESEPITVRFHAVSDKLCNSLNGFPCDELEISDEGKEQIELMCKQLRRAKKRTDTQDIELAVDMMVVFSKTDDRNADRAIIERLAKKLELRTTEDLEKETIAVRKLVKARGGQNADSTQQSVDLLNKFKQLAGMETANIFQDGPSKSSKMLAKSTSSVIPKEFLCPITNQMMTDPVIIASGQTYERESIQKWFDSKHCTCPKTEETLAHLNLAPNYALKKLIQQWCEQNKFELPRKEASPFSSSICTEQQQEISTLIENLSSRQLEVQRKAVKKIRMLSKESPDTRVSIANSGAVQLLLQLLPYPDSGIQEHAVTALLNLSIDDANKELITREGAIPAIIRVLENGSAEARANSAAALCSLSMRDENKVTVGLSDGIPPLVALLRTGTIRGKQDAATALFNLVLNYDNRARAIRAGIVNPLLKLLVDKNLGMVDVALSIFYLLAAHPEGRQEIGQLSFMETLVEFTRDGTPKNKECATSVILELGSNNSSFILAALQFGVYEHLVELTKSGTIRGQRKANALLQLIRKSEQI